MPESLIPFTHNAFFQGLPLVRYFPAGRSFFSAFFSPGLILSGLILSGLILSGLILSGLILSGLILSGLILSGISLPDILVGFFTGFLPKLTFKSAPSLKTSLLNSVLYSGLFSKLYPVRFPFSDLNPRAVNTNSLCFLVTIA